MTNSLTSSDYSSQSMVDVARIAKITRQLYERQQFAYVLVDHTWLVLETSSNLESFGFEDLPRNSDARESIDLLIGLDSRMTLDLPIVMSPTGHPVHIVLLPEQDFLTIVLMDASHDYEQQQLVQQKANENELLLIQQRRLTEDLEATQAALVNRNRELREAGRLQSSFMSGASHEFRTPLAALLGYVELLKDRFQTQPPARTCEQIGVIGRSARHLLSLVENLLDHGKLDAEEMVLNPQRVSLQTVRDELHDMLKASADKKYVELVFSNSPEVLPHCLLDDSRLRQILLNVVGNAIKFTDEGEVNVAFNWVEEELEVVVRDTGIGIDQSDVGQVFQPFWQAPHNGRVGTGLGLTITERILDMMGGNLELVSELGVGTTVRISLPAPEVEGSSTFVNRVATDNTSVTKVLLAEDDMDIAALLTLLLQERGIDVKHVDNGEDAVMKSASESFDVILMDLQMPILDGYAATQQIRASGSSTPVLVMTASAIESDRTRAEQAGCDAYLIKPVVIDEVLALADDLIAASRQS